MTAAMRDLGLLDVLATILLHHSVSRLLRPATAFQMNWKSVCLFFAASHLAIEPLRRERRDGCCVLKVMKAM